MREYIDKSALVAEIERRMQEHHSGYLVCLKDILSLLDTFETKEVDLDIEVALWANALPEIRLDDVERLAKYFFELGLKAQKGE